MYVHRIYACGHANSRSVARKKKMSSSQVIPPMNFPLLLSHLFPLSSAPAGSLLLVLTSFACLLHAVNTKPLKSAGVCTRVYLSFLFSLSSSSRCLFLSLTSHVCTFFSTTCVPLVSFPYKHRSFTLSSLSRFFCMWYAHVQAC